MPATIDRLDDLIRHHFRELNTRLDEHYFSRETLLIDDETHPFMIELAEKFCKEYLSSRN